MFGKNDPSHAELLQMPPAAAEAARANGVAGGHTLSDHRQRADRLALIFVAVKFPRLQNPNARTGAGGAQCSR